MMPSPLLLYFIVVILRIFWKGLPSGPFAGGSVWGRLVNAMRLPSGDHAGFEAGSGVFVRRQASPPSLPISQTCPFSSPRSLTKAIVLPSGDHCGAVSRFGPFVS